MISRYVRSGVRGPEPASTSFLLRRRRLPFRFLHVLPEHIKSVAHPVLRHRILRNFNAEADRVTTDDIITTLLDWVEVDDTDPDTKTDGSCSRLTRFGREMMDNRRSKQPFQAESYLAPETLVQLSTLELRARMIVEEYGPDHTHHHTRGCRSNSSNTGNTFRETISNTSTGGVCPFGSANHQTIRTGDDARRVDSYGLFGFHAIRFVGHEEGVGWNTIRKSTGRSGPSTTTPPQFPPPWRGCPFSSRTGIWCGTVRGDPRLQHLHPKFERSMEEHRLDTQMERSPTKQTWKGVEHMLSLTRNRSLIILVSDFLQDEDSIRNSIARIRHHKRPDVHTNPRRIRVDTRHRRLNDVRRA